MAKTLQKMDGDLVLSSSNGRYVWIDGIQKATQEVADALMSEYDPERNWGSQLSSIEKLNGSKSGPAGLINRGYIKTLVRDAIERLQLMQRKRPDQIDSYETIQSIGNVRVLQISRTGYVFFVDSQTAAGPDKLTSSFLVQARHQFLPGSKPNLPGSIVTDDMRTF